MGARVAIEGKTIAVVGASRGLGLEVRIGLAVLQGEATR